MNDLRHAFVNCATLGFTVMALATVAMCLGANLAIFAVIDAILLRPLPFPKSDRLVTIFNTYPKPGVQQVGRHLRGNGRVFSRWTGLDRAPGFPRLSNIR